MYTICTFALHEECMLLKCLLNNLYLNHYMILSCKINPIGLRPRPIKSYALNFTNEDLINMTFVILRLSFFFFFGKKWNRTHDFISRHIPFLSYLRSHLCAHLPCFWMCFVVCLFFPLSDILVYTTNELDEWEILSVLFKQILQPCLYNTKTDDMGQRNISQIRSNILLGWVFTGKKSLGKIGFPHAWECEAVSGSGKRKSTFYQIHAPVQLQYEPWTRTMTQ